MKRNTTLVASLLLLASQGSAQDWDQKIPFTDPSVSLDLDHMQVYDSTNGETILFGREKCGALPGEMWSWDGCQFSKRTPSVLPVGRYQAAGTHDTWRGHTYMFGGTIQSGAETDELWRWDGTNWTLVPTIGAKPRAVTGPEMAYDPVIDRIVMFGGLDVNGAHDPATYLFNPANNTWSSSTPITSPVSRQGHAMVYSQALGGVVLFGGKAINGAAARNDVHLYDSNTDTWRRLYQDQGGGQGSTYPWGRENHGMAVDLDKGGILVMGGDGSMIFDDVWEFNGTAWTNITPGPVGNGNPAVYQQVRPPAVTRHGLTYDIARSQFVSYGVLQGAGSLWTRDSGFPPVTLPDSRPLVRQFAPEAAGSPSVRTDDCSRVGGSVTFQLKDLPPPNGATVGIFQGWIGTTATAGLPAGAQQVHIDVAVGLTPLITYPGTTSSQSVPIPSDLGLVGQKFYYQAAALDGTNFQMSRAVVMNVGT